MPPFSSHRPPLFRQLAAGGLLSLCTAFSALGEALLITNHGFEDISGESPYNEFTFGPFNGWQLYDPGNITGGGAGPTFYIGTMTPFIADPINNPGVYTYFPGGAAEGNRVGMAFNYSGSGNLGAYGLRQTLSSVLTEGFTYTLQVEIGNIGSGTSVSGDPFNLSGFPGYRVELWAGSTFLTRDDNTLATSIADGTFATSTINFTPLTGQAGLGDNLEIRLINLNVVDPAHPGSDLEVDFDNVRLDASAVPEPATWALLGLGAITLAALRRRQ